MAKDYIEPDPRIPSRLGVKILGADLGLVILWGMAVALVSLVAGWLFAVLVASRTYISPEAGPGQNSHREWWPHALLVVAQIVPSTGRTSDADHHRSLDCSAYDGQEFVRQLLCDALLHGQAGNH